MFKLNSLNSLRALRHLHAFQSAGIKALTTCSSLLLKQSNPLFSPSPSPSSFTPSHNIHVVRNYQSSRDLRPGPLKGEDEKQLQKSSNGDPAVAYSSRSGEELVKECITKGTELVQAIANSLFNLPSTEDIDGPIVQLSLPEAKLPR